MLDRTLFLADKLTPLNFCKYRENIYGGSSLIDNKQFTMLKEKYDITVIVSLTSYSLTATIFENGTHFYKEQIQPEANFLEGVEEMGFTLYHIPIDDGGIPKCQQLVNIVDIFNRELNDGKKIYVHCWRGNGRTRTVIGSYLKLTTKLDIFFVIEKLNADKKEKEKLSYEQTHFLEQLDILTVINSSSKYALNNTNEPSNNELNTVVKPNLNTNKINNDALKIVFSSDKSKLIVGKFSDVFTTISYDFDMAVKDLELAKNPPIMIHGKQAKQHRDIGFFSDVSKGYYYSGQLMPSQPLTAMLTELLTLVNQKFCPFETNRKYNGILINRYENGNNYIGAHSDNEKDLGANGVVAISLGATRKFRIRNVSPMQVTYEHYKNGGSQMQILPRKSKEIMFDLPLEDKTIVWMEGDFQKEFTHEIPVERKVKESRISLTFRCHLH